MHDKLKLLLDQISMNKDCYTYFSNGTLDKISVNKQNESAKFLITLDKILPLDVYDLFHELLARKYNTYYVDSLFNIRNIDYSDVLSYIIYFMQVNYPDDYEETYKELDIEIVNDVIKINGINDSLNEEFKDFINKQKGWRYGEYVIFKFKLNNIIAFKNPVSNDNNNIFTYDGISRKNIVEILTDYRDFEGYKESDDTSEFSHKKLN